jgi:hypothetical protein
MIEFLISEEIAVNQIIYAIKFFMPSQRLPTIRIDSVLLECRYWRIRVKFVLL